MPDPSPTIEKTQSPLYVEHPVRCRQCDRVFGGYVYRIVNTAKEVTLLLDADGDTVYDLVKVCGKCKTVYHWHSNDKTLRDNTAAFERLMRHYRPRDAIIKSDNSTG